MPLTLSALHQQLLVINKLKSKGSPGPDNIPFFSLKIFVGLSFVMTIYLLQRPCSNDTPQFHSRDAHLLIKDLNYYARPILEYWSSIWAQYLSEYDDKIEKVQRHFTKKLRGLKHIPYSEALKIEELQHIDLAWEVVGGDQNWLKKEVISVNLRK